MARMGFTPATVPLRTLNPANETVQAGKYLATTLSAVDSDLAVGNINKDTVIFGFTGTLASLAWAASGGNFDALGASVADFQTNPATGDITNVSDLNDDNEVNTIIADAISEFAEVDYGKIVLIKRWRQLGHSECNGDGTWKLQYWNLVTLAWEDWVASFPTKAAGWSTMANATPVFTSKIKLICTTVDSGGPNQSKMREMEVIL